MGEIKQTSQYSLRLAHSGLLEALNWKDGTSGLPMENKREEIEEKNAYNYSKEERSCATYQIEISFSVRNRLPLLAIRKGLLRCTYTGSRVRGKAFRLYRHPKS